ncbi:unnamed protein product [Symbiodinium natans]|uniref:PPPDE domain-containing protein n=1 Tax=Symbiodinium natans TaxID=878477 RepID=A0A812N161_9DINO|nr:unnamed protein product [Symbiodinium natans]
MLQAEAALEAWSQIQPSGTSAPAPELGASLPKLADQFHLGDGSYALSICSGPQNGTTGDVEFLSFWRALSEAQSQSSPDQPSTDPPACSAETPCEEMGPDHLIRELEQVRDELLDRFEAGAEGLPASVLGDVVHSIRERSVAPEFWNQLLAELRTGAGVLSVSEVTVVLLTWLRDAAGWQLHPRTCSATLSTGTTASGSDASERCDWAFSEELTMLAGHLRQALDLGMVPAPAPAAAAAPANAAANVSNRLVTTAAAGPGLRRPDVESLAAEDLDHNVDHPGEYLVECISQSNRQSCSLLDVVAGSGYSCAQNANMRSAMLNLSADMLASGTALESQRGWMRSALLPLAPQGQVPEPSTPAEDKMFEADGTTMTRPLGESLEKEELEHLRLRRSGDPELSELCAGRATRERAFIRSAMLPLSTLSSPGEVNAGLPVFVHIYDVTQEAGIRRLNKVLANKRLPIKFGGVFHAGVEVNGEEWSYGATETEEEPGVNRNRPKMHPDHHYRQTVVMPHTQLTAPQIQEMMEQLSQQYPGPAYDLLRRNCCHFADDFCQHLGVGRIPPWVYRLARIAARIENFLQAAQRIRTPC